MLQLLCDSHSGFLFRSRWLARAPVRVRADALVSSGAAGGPGEAYTTALRPCTLAVDVLRCGDALRVVRIAVLALVPCGAGGRSRVRGATALPVRWGGPGGGRGR